jgi:hypothetical protein
MERALYLEVRDRMTFLPVLAVALSTYSRQTPDAAERLARQAYLLGRCGYGTGERAVMLTRLSGDGSKAYSDPYGWGDRTFIGRAQYIIEHWEELRDGDVVDVQFILGETPIPATSERLG